MDSPLVSVCIPTYNQENFIIDALEGALMQKDCDFEIILANDGSTDGTTRICREYAAKYPDIIRLIDQPHNKGIIINTRDCLLAARGKYIAICEGDDYWCDDRKLQKQVDILETQPEVTIVHTNWHNLEQATGKITPTDIIITDLLCESQSGKASVECLVRDSYRGMRFSTMMFRKKVLDDALVRFPDLFAEEYSTLDVVIVYICGWYGKFTFLPDFTSVYRRQDESVSFTSDEMKRTRYALGCLRIRAYFIEECGLSNDLREYVFHRSVSGMAPTIFKYRGVKEAEEIKALARRYRYRLRLGQRLCFYGAVHGWIRPVVGMLVK